MAEKDDVHLPDTDMSAVLQVDLTPDEGLALRILQVYRKNCDVRWSGGVESKELAEVYNTRNEYQRQRASLLDAAIYALKRPAGSEPNLTP